MEANTKNRNYRDFIHSNKFDYGYDPNGGSRAFSTDKGTPAKGVKDFMPFDPLKNKERDQKQSFKIYGDKKVQNSDGKRIGETLDKFVKNEID